MYSHRKQKNQRKTSGQIWQAFKLFNPFSPHSSPLHSFLRQMQRFALGMLSNSLVWHMAHQVIFLVLLNFSSCSHLPPTLSLLSCTIYELLSLSFCTRLTHLVTSPGASKGAVGLPYGAKRCWYNHKHCLRLACSPADASVVLLLLSVKACSASIPLLLFIVSHRVFCMFDFVQHQRQVIFWGWLTPDLRCKLQYWLKVQT